MRATVNNVHIEFNVDNGNCKILNSYKVTSVEVMGRFIDVLFKIYPEFKARSKASYIREWKAHNWMYDHHIQESRTKDTDLNINEYWYRRLSYFFISMLYSGK